MKYKLSKPKIAFITLLCAGIAANALQGCSVQYNHNDETNSIDSGYSDDSTNTFNSKDPAHAISTSSSINVESDFVGDRKSYYEYSVASDLNDVIDQIISVKYESNVFS